jgi:hypothetical protein
VQKLRCGKDPVCSMQKLCAIKGFSVSRLLCLKPAVQKGFGKTTKTSKTYLEKRLKTQTLRYARQAERYSGMWSTWRAVGAIGVRQVFRALCALAVLLARLHALSAPWCAACLPATLGALSIAPACHLHIKAVGVP